VCDGYGSCLFALASVSAAQFLFSKLRKKYQVEEEEEEEEETSRKECTRKGRTRWPLESS
jgi:hypothetical protein